ncbi:MAG: hypothetical protein WD738_08745 [Pirellulales bacterium]
MAHCDGQVSTVGQWPPFGPNTPALLLRLIQNDKDIFLQGRRAESLNLGIGAYAYYRRVVENEKDRLFEKIINVARQLKVAPEIIAKLEAAKTQQQFKQAFADAKDAIPEALKIDGYNPLTLLHSATSKGIHEMSDAECLQRAQDIRLVLVALAERMSAVTKENAALKAALGRLASGLSSPSA